MAKGLRSNSQDITTRQMSAPVTGPPPDSAGPGSGDPALARLQGADDLRAIEVLGGSGLAARTGANAWALRTLQPDAGAILSWTNGGGVAGNPAPAFSPQDANRVLAGPSSGSPAVPAFRALVLGDLPNGASGSFTPEMTFASPGDLSVAYGLQDGQYVRIGSLVFVSIRIAFTPTFSSASGNIRITGLPFAPILSAYAAPALFSNTPTFPGGTDYALAQFTNSQTYCQMLSAGSGDTTTFWTAADYTSGALYNHQFTGAYLV